MVESTEQVAKKIYQMLRRKKHMREDMLWPDPRKIIISDIQKVIETWLQQHS